MYKASFNNYSNNNNRKPSAKKGNKVKYNKYGKGSEFDLQKRCVQWLRETFPDTLFCSTLGGEMKNAAHGLKMKQAGYNKGIPDLMIYTPPPDNSFIGFAIEFKVKGNQPSPEQKQWMINLFEIGWKVLVIREYSDFINEVTNYIVDEMEVDQGQ